MYSPYSIKTYGWRHQNLKLAVEGHLQRIGSVASVMVGVPFSPWLKTEFLPHMLFPARVQRVVMTTHWYENLLIFLWCVKIHYLQVEGNLKIIVYLGGKKQRFLVNIHCTLSGSFKENSNSRVDWKTSKIWVKLHAFWTFFQSVCYIMSILGAHTCMFAYRIL